MVPADGRRFSDEAGYAIAQIAVRRAEAESAVLRMRAQIALLTSSASPDLPAVGTTLSEALLAEAAELGGQPGPMLGTMAMGYRAGRDAVTRGLRARAAGTRRGGADDPRPAPATEPGKPPLRFRPWEPSAEERLSFVDAHGWLARELPPRERPDFFQTVAELFDMLVEQSRAGTELTEIGDRIDPADARWRNALASELRAHAHEFLAQSGSNADPFTLGYRMATEALARRLLERAERIAVPGPS